MKFYRGRDICRRFNNGERFERMSDKENFGRISVQHPSELVANSPIVQEIIREPFNRFNSNTKK